ncbi:hypothetical protein [Paenibacillus oceani]|uniref:Uncharacterized protein n=1 Tax=Paenibacillus oceani TaxID=2772510 RepID=A0A927H337_9BACL|nr:hypothetical protein [Paenibacillus oceani]MBD2866465.1 hypothetical protein [Paenibacillus oceani]
MGFPLDSLKTEGWIADDIDSLRASKSIYKLLDGGIINYNLYGEPLDAETLSADLIRLLQ